MIPGDAFTVDEHPGLWIVLSDPDIDGESVLVAPTTDIHAAEASGFYLGQNSHTFLTSNCWLDFSVTTVVSIVTLNKLADDGSLIRRGPCLPTVIQRIWSEVGLSKRMRNDFKALLRKQGKVN